ELAGGGLVHAGEQRVVVGAEATGQVGFERRPGAAYGRDVVGVVDRLDDGVGRGGGVDHVEVVEQTQLLHQAHGQVEPGGRHGVPRDRKSTRLNSSHVKISYAVFCLKKKKITSMITTS